VLSFFNTKTQVYFDPETNFVAIETIILID